MSDEFFLTKEHKFRRNSKAHYSSLIAHYHVILNLFQDLTE